MCISCVLAFWGGLKWKLGLYLPRKLKLFSPFRGTGTGPWQRKKYSDKSLTDPTWRTRRSDQEWLYNFVFLGYQLKNQILVLGCFIRLLGALDKLLGFPAPELQTAKKKKGGVTRCMFLKNRLKSPRGTPQGTCLQGWRWVQGGGRINYKNHWCLAGCFKSRSPFPHYDFSLLLTLEVLGRKVWEFQYYHLVLTSPESMNWDNQTANLSPWKGWINTVTLENWWFFL